MKVCKNCRFFTGKTCDITGYNRMSTSSCVHFASNISSDNSKKCKDCRFFNGKICNMTGYKRTPSVSCIHFSLYR